MNRRIRMAGRRLRVAALGVAAALWTVGLAGCPVGYGGVVKPTEDCSVRYSLEVANNAGDGVRIRLDVGGGVFYSTGTFNSGIVTLESEAKRTFMVTFGLIGCEAVPESNNEYVSAFAEICFFDQRSNDPYKCYAYPTARCADAMCSNVMHRSSDGTWENLFVESPDRPFYLERDGEEPDLARIVITFVPTAESGSTGAPE